MIIISDCDMTYDLSCLDDIYDPIVTGVYDVVIGNRFRYMEKGAMSITHKVGVRALSLFGRMRYHVDIVDFHCGLRGLTKEALSRLSLKMDGMEFATEMIAEAAINDLKIGQTGVMLRCCPYKRKSKLRTVRDGLRHLLFILIYKGEKNYE